MDSLKDYIGDKKAYLAIMNGDGTRYLDIIRARIKEMFPQCEVVYYLNDDLILLRVSFGKLFFLACNNMYLVQL